MCRVSTFLPATAIFSVITTYNDFLIALTLTSTPDAQTVPVGVSTLIGKIQIEWGPMAAAGVIGALAVGLYLVELIGPALGWSSWVLDLSPYHHLSLVPTTSPAWAAVGIMLGIGVAVLVGTCAAALSSTATPQRTR